MLDTAPGPGLDPGRPGSGPCPGPGSGPGLGTAPTGSFKVFANP